MRAIERVRDAFRLLDDAAFGDGDVRGVARLGCEHDGARVSRCDACGTHCVGGDVAREGGLVGLMLYEL